MNLALLDPFRKSSPDRVECTLSYPTLTDPALVERDETIDATAMSFNRRGTYLGVGYGTGSVIIWDFLSRTVARHIEDVHPDAEVFSVDWSRRGRVIFTSGGDGFLALVQVDEVPCSITRIPFLDAYCLQHPATDEESADLQQQLWINKAMLQPRTLNRALCVLSDGMLVVTTLSNDPQITIIHRPDNHTNSENNRKLSHPHKRPPSFVTHASFDKNGKHIFATTHSGHVHIYETSNYSLVSSFKVQGSSSPIKSITFSKDGKMFLLNSSDSVIRLFRSDSRDGRPRLSYQDIINKVKWKDCCFSHDGEHVVGASTSRYSVNLYVWNTDTNVLVDLLKGPQMELRTLAYHPARSCLATGTADGCVDMWGIPMNWTALAPDFQALPKNVEYIENEDEFDIVAGQEEAKALELEMFENQEVDVVGIEKITVFESDSENEEDVLFLRPEINITATEGGKHKKLKY